MGMHTLYIAFSLLAVLKQTTDYIIDYTYMIDDFS